MKPYAIVEKKVGETPLIALEKFRKSEGISASVPLAYAGRLDPMASGKLIILIGDECKKQETYFGLDKAYTFEVLLGTQSDTGDVLGLLEWKNTDPIKASDLQQACETFTGKIALPYPHFSSKTVEGKPLHVWTLEGRLDEIEIPVTETTVYQLALTDTRTIAAEEIYAHTSEKIETIPPVTEKTKQLGNDFRRPDVRIAWKVWLEHNKGNDMQIATFDCICSSGTYMRSLAEEIGKNVSTYGLAYSIHREKIGHYQKLPFGTGFWRKEYTDT